MFRLQRWMMRPLWALQKSPWPPSTARPNILDPSELLGERKPTGEPIELVEEERTPYYDPKRFYPAILGEVLNDRYQLSTKLGYGSSSTVWLARDLYQWRWARERYVALKINAAARPGSCGPENELQIGQAISNTRSRHKGQHFVRGILDSFTQRGPNDQHLCFVYEVLREPLWIIKRRFIDNVIPADTLKVVVVQLLHGLDFLHNECQVIYTDLKSDNILGTLEDDTLLDKSALDEFRHPLPQKTSKDRIIYISRNEYGMPNDMSVVLGRLRITDFGFARRGPGPHYGAIQAEQLRAPEVILDAGWSYSVDIWNLAIMLWDVMENRFLFEAVDTPAEYDDATHLASITAMLGTPPASLLSRGRRTRLYYERNGGFKSDVKIPDISFQEAVTQIEDAEEKAKFIRFIKRMLTWDPEKRSTARELLSDPWVKEVDG